MPSPDGVIWTLNGTNRLQPEEIPSKLKDLIEVKKHKGDKSENRYIFVNRLRYFGLDIIQLIHILGYQESKEHSFKKMASKTYTYLIGDNLCFYSIRIKYSKRYTVTFIDLDNFLSISSPRDIIDTWGTKSEYTVQNLGVAYIRSIRDIIRLSGIKRNIPVTLSGVSRRVFFRDRQKYYDCRDCSSFFDSAEPYFRAAYHGGLNLLKDSTYIKEYGEGIVLDVNSLYPYVMLNGVYPVGKPWSIPEGKLMDTIRLAREGKVYFYIRIKARFELKPDGIPCVAMGQKDSQRWYHDKGFMTDSRFINPDQSRGKELKEVELTLTQTDFFLFMSNYNITSMTFVSCYVFQGKKGLFADYVRTWYQLKEQSSGGTKRVAKMFLNSLSGSMARRIDYINGLIYFDERDEAQVKYSKVKSNNPKCYVHIGAAITSYARAYIIKYIKTHYDRWLYTDTDSLHLTGKDVPPDVTIGNEIGQFKVEKDFDSICYYGLKEYGYHDQDGYHFVMAGVEKRDTTYLAKYLNHESTNDDWVLSAKKEDIKTMKELFRSGDKLIDLFYAKFPVSVQSRNDWFNSTYIYSWKTFYKGEKIIKKNPVRVKGIVTTVKAEKERDEKARIWYEKKHKDDKTLPLEDWLRTMAVREKNLAETTKEEWKREKAIKTGDFYKVSDKDFNPFDEVNKELGTDVFI